MTNYQERVVIIGAGAFGLSTALHLARKGYESVTVLDRSLPPVADGSSVDISRIIRFDYTDKIYSSLAKEAYQEWQSSDIFGPAFYHSPFLITVQQSKQPNVPSNGYLETLKPHLKSLGQSWTDVKSREEAVRHFPALKGQLASPKFEGYINQNAGWADAAYAITLLRDECSRAGVSFITGPRGTVTRLIRKANGAIEAVETVSRQTIPGDLFILSAGAWSSRILQMGQATLPTAQIVGFLSLSNEEAEALKQLPIYVNLSTGVFSFPTHPTTKTFKIACHGFGYTNYVQAQDSASFSAPPQKTIPGRANFIPADGLNRLREGLVEILGPEYAKREFTKTVLCWYTDTPSGDFIIDYHPRHENLLVATGGSGHAFKFLPTLGKYIVQALERTLSEPLRERWKLDEELLDGKREFVGDGSRGGPPRRELTANEKAKL